MAGLCSRAEYFSSTHKSCRGRVHSVNDTLSVHMLITMIHSKVEVVTERTLFSRQPKALLEEMSHFIGLPSVTDKTWIPPVGVGVFAGLVVCLTPGKDHLNATAYLGVCRLVLSPGGQDVPSFECFWLNKKSSSFSRRLRELRVSTDTSP